VTAQWKGKRKTITTVSRINDFLSSPWVVGIQILLIETAKVTHDAKGEVTVVALGTVPVSGWIRVVPIPRATADREN
jgi:hypothetical protein